MRPLPRSIAAFRPAQDDRLHTLAIGLAVEAMAVTGGYLMGGIWLAVLFAALAAIVLIVDRQI